MYVCSLGERAAPPSSWSRALTTFYGPLYLAVTCSILFLPEEYSRIRRIQRFLVRQWIRFLYEFPGCTCVFGSCRLLEEFRDFLREGVHSALEVVFSGREDPTGVVLGYVLDMPVIVHDKVVDIPFMAQRLFPLVLFGKP